MHFTLVTLLLTMAANLDSGSPSSNPVLGTVRKVDLEAGRFEIKGRKGKLEVVLEKDPKLIFLRRSILRDTAMGEKTHVLAERKTINWGTGTTEEIVQVTALVTGEGFSPPPVPAALDERNIAWHSGNLSHESMQNKYFLDHLVWVHASPGNPIYVVEEVKGNPLERLQKGQTVCLRGSVDREKKTMKVSEGTIFTTRVPTKEIPLIVNLKEPEKEKQPTKPKAKPSSRRGGW